MRSEFLNRIKEKYGDKSCVYILAYNLIMENIGSQMCRPFFMGHERYAKDFTHDDRDSAISILENEGLLERKHMLYVVGEDDDGDDDYYHELDEDELRYYLEENIVMHPDSGNEIRNPHIENIVFSTDYLKSMLIEYDKNKKFFCPYCGSRNDKMVESIGFIIKRTCLSCNKNFHIESKEAI